MASVPLSDRNGPPAPSGPPVAAFQPAGHLTNRTFVGLIIAQFLAGFNDQAIHASAMFYAINTGILTEGIAISLMPVLFFAPWAIFCTLAGYFADRYSKTFTLITWKLAEVLIALVLIAGFYLGTNQANPRGAWLVMSCVFWMGMHSAFFAPAKYGAMPQILQAHVLSKGNGILESTTFLASILGTVVGGLLSSLFKGQEIWIGVVLLVLSVVGALASFLIAWLPPANPSRPFPVNLFKPLYDNLRTLLRARPLALSVLGIAFFIFMVAYMRGAVYMHGETRNPRWDEFKTSLIVAVVALGVGVGSPLAGYLSGGKIELGLVPLACVGMILATLGAALAIEHTTALIVALIVIGFFSGFYMVPLYTLLQHRAPKQSKGDLIATSNFINVVGAMTASVLFALLVLLSQRLGVTPEVKVQDGVAEGRLIKLRYNKHGRLEKIKIDLEDGTPPKVFQTKRDVPKEAEIPEVLLDLAQEWQDETVVDSDENDVIGNRLSPGDQVIVARYEVRSVVHFQVRAKNQPLKPVYDNEVLPRYLFLVASLMTLAILVLLCRKLPDFPVRTLFWLRSLRRYKIRANGMHHLPTYGPVILATNAHTLDGSLQLVSATDRSTRVVLLEEGPLDNGGLLRSLARRTSLIELRAGQLSPQTFAAARQRALQTLADGHLLAVSVDGQQHSGEIEALLAELHRASGAPILPTFCGPLDATSAKRPLRVRVIFGEALTVVPALPEVRQSIQDLAEWARHHDDEDPGVAVMGH